MVDDKPLRTSNEEQAGNGAKPKPAKGSRRKKGYSKTESCEEEEEEDVLTEDEEAEEETEEAVKEDTVEVVVVARSGDDLD